jgi:O-antigen ligase
LVVFIIIVQAIATPAAYRRITGAYAYATLVACLMSFYVGRSVEHGRLALDNGTFGDPNQFALALVVGLPFWWDKAQRAATAVKKTYCLLCTVPIYIAFAKAGSRSGLLAFGTLMAVTFALAPMGRKLLIATGCVLMILLGTFLLPDYLRARYVTIFSPADAQQASTLRSDIDSSEGRKQLLLQSIRMTFEHPIVGVGPGVFSLAAWDQRKQSTGAGGIAQVAHNTYTQVSSETGIPGFVFFVATWAMALKSVLTASRGLSEMEPVLSRSGRHLFSTLAAFSVGAFFLTMSYSPVVSALLALAVGLSNLKETLQQTPEQEPVQTAPLIASTSGKTPAMAAPPATSKALRVAGLPNSIAEVKPVPSRPGHVANSKSIRAAGLRKRDYLSRARKELTRRVKSDCSPR